MYGANGHCHTDEMLNGYNIFFLLLFYFIFYFFFVFVHSTVFALQCLTKFKWLKIVAAPTVSYSIHFFDK